MKLIQRHTQYNILEWRETLPLRKYEDTEVTSDIMIYNLPHEDMFILIHNLSIKS